MQVLPACHSVASPLSTCLLIPSENSTCFVELCFLFQVVLPLHQYVVFCSCVLLPLPRPPVVIQVYADLPDVDVKLTVVLWWTLGISCYGRNKTGSNPWCIVSSILYKRYMENGKNTEQGDEYEKGSETASMKEGLSRLRLFRLVRDYKRENIIEVSYHRRGIIKE